MYVKHTCSVKLTFKNESHVICGPGSGDLGQLQKHPTGQDQKFSIKDVFTVSRQKKVVVEK